MPDDTILDNNENITPDTPEEETPIEPDTPDIDDTPDQEIPDIDIPIISDPEYRDSIDVEDIDTTQPIIYERFTDITFHDTEFHLIATTGFVYQVKNKSGYPFFIALNTDASELKGDVYQQQIGGISYEVRTLDDHYTWIRATKPDTTISIRPLGAFDPTESVAELGSALNQLIFSYNTHVKDVGNPHNVTKNQVGLSEIPNAISDDPKINDHDVLSTTANTNAIYIDLQKHKARTDNPHDVTKAQVGLGNVDNYPTADWTVLEDCLDTVDNKFVTPAAAHRIAKMVTAVAFSTKPQIVVSCLQDNRHPDWMQGECDAPSLAIYRKSNTHVVIPKGLIVSYATEHKIRISEDLREDMEIPISYGEDLTYYVYVSMNQEGLIIDSGVSRLPPIYSHARNGQVGDWYNMADCIMYDDKDRVVRRVYLGTVITDNDGIQKVIPVPQGDSYTVPLGYDLILSGRYLLDNPFITEKVDVIPEVLYRDGWAPTGWNDQIGVLGGPHPSAGNSTLVVQAGQMGFLACGRESGSTFGSAFTTINSPLRCRVVIARKF